MMKTNLNNERVNKKHTLLSKHSKQESVSGENAKMRFSQCVLSSSNTVETTCNAFHYIFHVYHCVHVCLPKEPIKAKLNYQWRVQLTYKKSSFLKCNYIVLERLCYVVIYHI